jgi:pilus assembly protein CpaE
MGRWTFLPFFFRLPASGFWLLTPMAISLMVASPDAHFREMIRESLLNVANATLIAEFPEIALNLYIRVLHELERHPHAALVLDLAGDTEAGIKALEKVKQAAPALYVVASHYQADPEITIACMRAGAQEFLTQPLKRTEFRDAMARVERAARAPGGGGARLGKIYTFLGAKGGVGTTTLAVNFAAEAAQNRRSTVLIDLDLRANDAALQLGAHPQYTLLEVAENLSRLDQTLFEGFVTRDPCGFYLVGPPDNLEQRGFFTDYQLKEFVTFLVEKHEAVVVDAGVAINDDLILAAMQVSSSVFLVLTQELAAIRNAQRYIAFLMRIGLSQDQIKLVVNRYTKKSNSNLATREEIERTLNQPIFFGVPEAYATALGAINKGRPVVAEPSARSSELDTALRAFVKKSITANHAVEAAVK